MVLRSTIAALAAFVSLTHAWLPNDSNKPMLDKRGFSLFESEAPKADADLSKRWTPGKLPIRGVNLGSLFVFEPWTDWQEWQKMGCSGYESEFDCVMKTGRDRSNTAFQNHYRDYINENDLNEMMGYGLNTIRVPLGYWLKEDLVESSAYFPKGGLDYLTKLVGWASDRGFYIILDLHGAPGAQQPNQPFTGQKNPNADFYNDYNYGRAIQWLEWMTKIIHTNTAYRNVGMLELVNEPLNWNSQVESLRSSFYKNAVAAIRKVEDGLGVKSNDRVHIQMMNSLWGSGNPTQYIGDKSSLAFDDHRYIKWDGSVAVNKDSYIRKSCDDNRGGDGPTIVGEWSIAVPDNVEKTPDWSPSGQKDFYKRWFAAQVHSYEKYTLGWIFWTWKANLGDDYRWSYQSAVKAGVIPKDFNQLPKVC